MINLIRAVLLGFVISLLSNAAFSQRIISKLSDKQISIDSSFTGETITIFGNIEPEIGSDRLYIEGTYSIAIVIQGPDVNKVVREKDRIFGIWLNRERVIFENFPSYYWLLTNDRVENFNSNGSFTYSNLLPKNQPFIETINHNNKQVEEQQEFSTELVRLMKKKGLFGINENGVKFHSNSLYSVRIKLPSDVPIGYYLATTYLFKDGSIISQRSEGFSIRKTGIERLLGTSAKQSPLLYGVFTVMLALFTGWLGGVAFRR